MVFGRLNFIEAAFARFKLVDGVGCSIVYSHRIYGEKIGDQMSAWLKDNGPKTEKMLMDWNNIPSPASLTELAAQTSSHRRYQKLCDKMKDLTQGSVTCLRQDYGMARREVSYAQSEL